MHDVIALIVFFLVLAAGDHLLRRRRKRGEAELDQSADDALRSLRQVATRRQQMVDLTTSMNGVVSTPVSRSEAATPVLTLVPRQRRSEYIDIRRRATIKKT
jgi:hypothetical protein